MKPNVNPERTFACSWHKSIKNIFSAKEETDLICYISRNINILTQKRKEFDILSGIKASNHNFTAANMQCFGIGADTALHWAKMLTAKHFDAAH